MASFRPKFIKQLTQAWLTEFPLIQPAQKGALPFRPTSGTFTIAASRSRFQKFTHLHFLFDPKRPPEFTVEIILSETERVPESGMRSCWREGIPTGKSGVYRIGMFMPAKYGDYWWGLARPTSPSGAEPFEMWRPKSFRLSFETIADMAIAHVGETLTEYVFPKLLAAW